MIKILKNNPWMVLFGLLVFILSGIFPLEAYPFGHAELQGKRPTMEDAYNVTKGDNFCLYGLYDGHGGALVSNQLAYNLNYCIGKRLKKLNPYNAPYGHGVRRYWAKVRHTFAHLVAPELEKETACENPFEEQIYSCLKKSYKQVNTMLDKVRCARQGSTALTALIIDSTLFIANTGDSRAVVSHEGKAIALSEDHKPNRPDEYERIIRAGGQIINYGVPRVQGVLALSRALGDFELNPYVICEPEIISKKIVNGDEFLILACDGVWDVLSNQEAVDIVRQQLTQSDDLTAAADALVQAAYKAGSTDNISALVIAFGSLIEQH